MLQKINKMISNDIKFTALHQHYNNTFSNIKESIKLRDRLTILIIFVLIFMTLYTFWPTDATTMFSQMTLQKLGLAINININFLGNIIWFALLIVIVRYTQIVVYIERQHVYIHAIEKELNFYYENSVVFTREGKSYLKKYPKFLDWVWILYMIIFPAFLIIIVLGKIINEWASINSEMIWPLMFNSLIMVCILISIILYMRFMHYQKDN